MTVFLEWRVIYIGSGSVILFKKTIEKICGVILIRIAFVTVNFHKRYCGNILYGNIAVCILKINATCFIVL